VTTRQRERSFYEIDAVGSHLALEAPTHYIDPMLLLDSTHPRWDHDFENAANELRTNRSLAARGSFDLDNKRWAIRSLWNEFDRWSFDRGLGVLVVFEKT
jgi:hypothetical protein